MKQEFNGFINVKYVKCNNNKERVDRQTYNIENITDWNEKIGILLPDDIVLVDSDTTRESEILLQIIKDKHLKCYVSRSQSGRGLHFYFRIPKDMKIKSESDRSIPLGLVDIDYKSGQKINYSIEKSNGKWNEWLIPPKYNEKRKCFILDSYDLDEIPYWLLPLKDNCLSLVDMEEGDGRDDELFKRHKFRLLREGYSEEMVKETFLLINTYVLKDSFSEKDIERISRFDGLDRNIIGQKWFDEKGHFLHAEMADLMAEVLYAYKDINGTIWYYNGKTFSQDERVLEQQIYKSCPILKANQRREVIDAMKLRDFNSTIKPIEHHDYVCVNNGLVNARTGKLIGWTPAYLTKTMLNVKYNANAYDKYVDKFLDEVLVEKGDKEQRMIFEEYLGYTLIAQDNFMKKMLFMIGTSSFNGKSTTQFMVRSLLGIDNASTTPISQINEANKHGLVELCNKLANFDDDAENTLIKGSSMSYLKTIISDENLVTIDPKFRDPYKTFIRAKMWVASNHIIKTEQKGDEWMGRLVILSFDNRFDPSSNPNIKNQITTDNAKSYLLRLAIEGYQRLVSKYQFTQSKTSEFWTNQYKMENDSVYRFFKSEDWKNKYDTVDAVCGKLLTSIYAIYKTYMEKMEPGLICTSMNKFERRLIEHFNNNIQIEVIDNARQISKVSNN